MDTILKVLYDVVIDLMLITQYILRKVSRRMRDRHLVWLTVQTLLPEDQRACAACEGNKCLHCGYSGLEVTRCALEIRR